MSETRGFELVNREIDSDLDAGELRELRLRLESDEELHGLRNDLQQIAGRLDSLGWLEPPRGFRRQILSELRRKPDHPGRITKIPAAARRRRTTVLVAAAASLLLVLVAAPFLLEKGRLDPADAGATMTRAAVRSATIVRDVDNPVGSGTVTLHRDETGSRVEIVVRLVAPATIAVRTPGASLLSTGTTSGLRFERGAEESLITAGSGSLSAAWRIESAESPVEIGMESEQLGAYVIRLDRGSSTQ